MPSSRDKRDLQWLTVAVVVVLVGFSWGVLPGLLGTWAAVVGGLVYRRRWRQTPANTADQKPHADALWQDAELALTRLERLQSDAVPAADIDRLARAGRRAVETARTDPFSSNSSDIRHVLGLMGECLGDETSLIATRHSAEAQRWATLFDETTQTLEHLSNAASEQESGMTVRLNVLEREVRSLNQRDTV